MWEPEVDTTIKVDADNIQSCVPAAEEECGNTVIRFKDGTTEYVVETVNEINVHYNGN